MAYETLKVVPGVDVEKTLADNAGGISESQFIRWRDKIPEKRGGWGKYINAVFPGVIKELWAWQGLNDDNRLAVASTQELNVVSDGNITDITAQADTFDIPVSFTTTIGSASVRVNDTGSNATIYDSVVFNTHISVGGVTLFGLYSVADTISADAYRVTAAVNADANVTGGGSVAYFTATSASSIVTMTLADHTFAVGDTISFIVPTYVGNVLIEGEYIVKAVPTADTLTFNAQNSATTAVVSNAVDNGATTTFTYTGTYQLTVGDTFVIAGMNPGSYDGTYTVLSLGSNTVTATDGVVHGAFVSGGTLFNSVSHENGGEVNLTYYITPGPAITGTGYGELAYGEGGYGTGSAAPTHTGTPITATDYWLSNWGEVLLSCPEGGPVFEWSITSGFVNSKIIENSPVENNGMFVAMPQQQVMVWGSTYNGLSDPLQIRWSDAGNYYVWTATSTNQAGGYHLPTGSKIIRGLQGANQCYWWTDVDLYISHYIGPPGVWGFNKIASGCGLIAPKAVGALGSVIYWMSQKQFFATGGGTGVVNLPCSVWDYVFQNMNDTYVSKIRAAPNSQFNEINWFFPSTASTGENDSYVCFNTLYNEWDYGAYVRTAWIDQSILGPPIGADGNSYVQQHETSNDADGAAITAYFKTGYFSIASGQDLVFVDRVLPDMKWGKYSEAQTASIQITFNVTDYAGQTPTAYGPFTVTQATTWIDVRFRGRFVQIVVQSSDTGSFWRLGSVRYRFASDGRR